MKTTVEIDNVFDEELKPLLLEYLKVADVWDFITDKLKVTIDWDVNIRNHDLSFSPRFDGYQSYAALDFEIQPKGICKIVIQYYLTENEGTDYAEIEFEVDVQLKGVENIQYDVIIPEEAELDLKSRTVIVTF